MISLNNIRVEFSGIDLFKNITFEIKPKDKIGLVGDNGAGKTTMLKVIMNEQGLHEGNVSIPKDVKIGYLPQHAIYPEGKTVLQETMTAFQEIKNIENEIENINNQISERTDYESDSYLKIITRFTELSDKLNMLDSATIEAQAELTLKGLGFEQSDFERPTSELSGGWRMRIELAKIILRRPNVFLLDEPTNHLDIESIEWLENYLKNYSGAVVIISHDRKFLDSVTTRTVEISRGKIYDYKANYTKYKELRKDRMKQQISSFDNQQKKIKETEDFIERFRYKASKANQVQSRVKQLEKLKNIDIDFDDKSSIHFRFPPAPRAGSIVVEMRDLSKSYDDNLVIDEIDFILERGEKIAFVGRNGEGKSTLAKVILKELDYTGNLKFGHNTQIGYYAQNQDETLEMHKTVFQTLDDVAVGDIRTKLRSILGAFLFGNKDIDKKVSVLSGGERARLALAKLLLQPYSLLVLDEPTNHLDMKSKDILKTALLQYDGTIILVSHDRDFLDGLTETIYEFRNKKVKQHKCSIYEFLKKKKLATLKDIEQKKKSEIKKVENVSNTKQDYFQKKEKQRQIAKIERKIAKSEENIEKLEQKIEETNDFLSNPENITDESVYLDYDKLKKELEDEMANWENLNEEL